ncbi:unnamed protein product [Effrenium voratum]|nr:unnamed protein product [Effrenium voratum]
MAGLLRLVESTASALQRDRVWKDAGLPATCTEPYSGLVGRGEASGNGPLALVVAPTRELAAQTYREAHRFAGVARVCLVHGGTAWEPQAAALEAGAELVVATPGRLAFLMARGGEAAANTAREIAACGARKQLAEALAAFDRFISNGGTATRHIYSTLLMNAHVLCGDLPGALKVSQRMQDAGLPLGVVEYTTLLKGHLAAGNITEAWKLIDTMTEAWVMPDLRTANTFLRGCVKLGALSHCEETFTPSCPSGILSQMRRHTRSWLKLMDKV